MREIGVLLKNRREELGLTIDEVKNRLKFSKNAIIEIENGDFSNFDDGLFLKMYLRKYTKLLGLDFKEIVETYDLDFGIADNTNISPSYKKNNYNRNFLKDSFSKFVFVLFLVMILVAAWFLLSESNDLFKQKKPNGDPDISYNEENNDSNDEGNDNEDETNKASLVFDSQNGENFIYHIKNVDQVKLKFEFSKTCWVGIYNTEGVFLTEFTQSTGEKILDYNEDFLKITIGAHKDTVVYVNDILVNYQPYKNNSYNIVLMKSE